MQIIEKKLNLNIGCIEISLGENPMTFCPQLNLNIGCIEMLNCLFFPTGLFVLNLNIGCIEIRISCKTWSDSGRVEP